MKHQLNIISKQTYCYNTKPKVMKFELKRVNEMSVNEWSDGVQGENEWNEGCVNGRAKRYEGTEMNPNEGELNVPNERRA